LGDIIR